MKKTTAYARKMRRQGATYNGGEWLNAIQRCRTYTDEPIPGSGLEGTQTAATKAELLVRQALDDLTNHRRPADCEMEFDRLSHAVGVAMIRALQIEPDEAKNPAIPILKAGTEALRRAIARYNAAKSWGLDGLGRTELPDAIDVYAEILRNSSPAQMAKATDERLKIIRRMAAEHQSVNDH